LGAGGRGLTIGFSPGGPHDKQRNVLGITGSLIITGGGASTTIIDGNKSARPNGRVLVIGSGITVNISGVTIRNGGTGGGGGGIFNVGTLTLTNSAVSGSSADGTGGAGGGGISNAGTLTLINTTVNGNNAGPNGGGIYNNGTMTLINSTVSGNTTDFEGGGIFNNGTATLSNSTIQNNESSGGNAGGILNRGTSMLTNSTVNGNSAVLGGGGILNSGTLTLTNSTVNGNSVSGRGNFPSSGSGGGIYNDSSDTLTLTNSTVSGNLAASEGGGIYNAGTANLFSGTIANNQADADLTGTGTGGGVFNQSGATLNFQNTILAGNLESAFLFKFFVTVDGDCAGTINSNGNNIIFTANCTINGSFIRADPLLGPLQNNGGPTQTHALLAGSPAIDAGNPGGCRDHLGVLLTTDQRGFPRPVDGNNDTVVRCDIGAYELFTGSNTSVVAAVLPGSRSVQVGTPATAFATVINTGPEIAAGCSIAPLTSIPATFVYQTTNPANNRVTGFPNTPAKIAAGAAQSFVFAVTPTAPFAPTDVQFSFDCANCDPAPINTGLNTLLLSASATPVPDIVALAATPPPDPGIVNVPGADGTGAFAVATVNVGASATITVSADTGSASLPVNISLCQTDPATGQCISGIGPSVSTTINAGATPTFGIFVQGNGNVPFDPAANRIFVRFRDAGTVTRGSTSVAVRTQ
jgi:hypothetical protein